MAKWEGSTYKFWDIEDVLSEEHCHAHLDGPLLFLVRWKFSGGGVGEELQARLVEVLLVFLSSVVVGEDFAQSSIYLRVDVALLFHLTFDFVQNLKTVVVKSQIQLLFSLCNSTKVDSIFEILESRLCLVKEFDGDIDICMLTWCKDCQHRILDRVQLVGQALNHWLIQDK